MKLNLILTYLLGLAVCATLVVGHKAASDSDSDAKDNADVVNP
jgi:hypothetical protein